MQDNCPGVRDPKNPAEGPRIHCNVPCTSASGGQEILNGRLKDWCWKVRGPESEATESSLAV